MSKDDENLAPWTGALARMSAAVRQVQERLDRSSAALARAGVPYAVAGANAVAAHIDRHEPGASRMTPNVDLLVRPLDFEAARRALHQAGFVWHGIATNGIFTDGHSGTARSRLLLVPAGQRMRDSEVEPNPDVSQSEVIDGRPVVSLEPLVRMKLTVFRTIDKVHLRDLMDVGLVDSRWASRLPLALRPRLQELLDDPHG